MGHSAWLPVWGFLSFIRCPKASQPWAWPRCLPAALGFYAMRTLERSALGSPRVAGVAPYLIGAGLFVHGALDGMAIAGVFDQHGGAALVGLAVLLHQVPMSAALWLTGAKKRSASFAYVLLGSLIVGTALGYAFSPALAAHSGTVGSALLQALLTGGLAHLVLHLPAESSRAQRVSSVLGSMLARLCVCNVRTSRWPWSGDQLVFASSRDRVDAARQ